MTKPASSPRAAGPAADTHCLVRKVAAAFAEEPALEAVKLNRAEHTLSVATLGRPDAAALEQSVAGRIEQLEQQAASRGRCGLLEGSPDCSRCPTPYPPEAVAQLRVEHEDGTTTIARVTCPTAPTFWKWKVLPLPRLIPREVVLPDETASEHEWQWQLAAALACGLLGLLGSFAFSGTSSVVAYALACLAGGCYTAREVWERLQHGHLDVHFLMLAVAAGSAAIGAWAEGTTLLFLFSLSGALEHYAMGRTSREIQSLFKSAPKTALVLNEVGPERLLPVEQLVAGLRLLVKPGEQFPVDAEVVQGQTAADESNLTGEATPVEKRVGDTLLAGTLNLWGAVEAVVLRPASQSALQRIIRLIREAQHLKAPSQRLTDKFGSGYTYAILGLTLIMFFVWWLVLDRAPFVSTGPQRSAFYLAMTLLVVSSPCALVLSIPSAVLAAIAHGARRGVLFRGGAAVENLATVSVVAMDKTGTLTTGELQVAHVESFPAGHEAKVAQLACSLDRFSTHPLARAITRHGKQQGIALRPVDGLESVPGAGMRGRVDGREVRLGRRAWITEFAPACATAAGSPAEPGFAEVWVASGELVGRVLLRDDLRAAARPVVEALRAMGLRTVVLTGDRKATGEQLRRHLAVDEVRAELHPEEKVQAVRALAADGHKVAMIGDGVNDAPSLAVADVGVAMGARGSDAALEQAEVVLMHDRLENFLAAFRLSQRARRIIQQNLVLSLGTVVVLAGCALLGAIPLTIGVLGHEGSTVVVVLNSLRLLAGGARDGQQGATGSKLA